MMKQLLANLFKVFFRSPEPQKEEVLPWLDVAQLPEKKVAARKKPAAKKKPAVKKPAVKKPVAKKKPAVKKAKK